jgi:hypothetical protein
MSMERIIEAWMTDPSITALVGNRVALHELPQSAGYPNLAYTILSDVPDPVIAYQTGPQKMWSRVQFNPYALTFAEVEAVHVALTNLMDFKHQITVGGKLIISSRRDNKGPASKDAMTLAWTKPDDYRIYWVE